MRITGPENDFSDGFDAAARQDAEEFKRLDAEIARLKRENADLHHHYKHHREAGERLHTQYHEVRDALREAVDVWASHLNGMPNIRSRKRLDEIRDQFGLNDEPGQSANAPMQDLECKTCADNPEPTYGGEICGDCKQFL